MKTTSNRELKGQPGSGVACHDYADAVRSVRTI
jgi:hypothetical protein